ncbi:MAG: hypothetical protein MUF04_12955, partial [Akkermansiaceae bacterium]|nr:hypothetical protein [Akkermansiaceae bacterium]
MFLLAGALRLRGLNPKGATWLRGAVWSRIGVLVIGLLAVIWAGLLDWESEVTYPRVPLGEALVVAVALVATGWEVAMLVWLRRNRARLDRLCQTTSAGIESDATGQTQVSDRSPRTSWKAVVSAVLAIPAWLQGAVASALVLSSLLRRNAGAAGGGGFGWAELGVLSIGGLFGLLGLVLGVVALGEIRRAQGRLRGIGLGLMGVLGAPFGMAVTMANGLLLGLGAAGYLPAALGRWLYPITPLFLGGLLAIAVIGLKRWVEPTTAARAGVSRRAFLVGAGAAAVLLLVPLAGMAIGPGFSRPVASTGATGGGLAGTVEAGTFQAGTEAGQARLSFEYTMSGSADVSVEAEGTAADGKPLTVEDLRLGRARDAARPSHRRRSQWELPPTCGADAARGLADELNTKWSGRTLTLAGTTQVIFNSPLPGSGSIQRVARAKSSGPRPMTGGFHLDFTIPPGQAAVFEVVTKRNGEVVPLPKLSAHALAPTDREMKGTLRLERDPANDLPGLRRPWQLELRCSEGVSSIAGVDIPSGIAAAIGASSFGRILPPDTTTIEWLHKGSDRQPAVGLRWQTMAHGRNDPEVNQGALFQLGTNWTAARPVAPAPAAALSLALSTPPRETLVIKTMVLSNGVPVDSGPLRTSLWPPNTRAVSPYQVRWQALATELSGTNSPGWQMVVEDQTSKTIAARLRPASLPPLEWTVSPAVASIRSVVVGREARSIEIARALQTAGGGNVGAADWSVRLQVQSSPVSPGTASRGADVDFVLPANQAVTFELVERKDGVLKPLPKCAAYVVNRANDPYSGKFILADDPEDLDGLTGLPKWRFGIVGPDGQMLEYGRADVLGIPAELTGARHWNLAMWRQLDPDREVVTGETNSTATGWALRIRTASVEPVAGLRQRLTGYGTNWVTQVPPRKGATNPTPVFGSVEIDLGARR